MKSKAQFDVDIDGNPIVAVHVIPSEDLRDKIAERFKSNANTHSLAVVYWDDERFIRPEMSTAETFLGDNIKYQPLHIYPFNHRASYFNKILEYVSLFELEMMVEFKKASEKNKITKPTPKKK